MAEVRPTDPKDVIRFVTFFWGGGPAIFPIAQVFPDLKVSGEECVEVLVRAGFQIASSSRATSSNTTTLIRVARLVVVPHASVLAREVLDAVLSDAAVSLETFLQYLLELRADGTFDDEPTRTGARRKRKVDETG